MHNPPAIRIQTVPAEVTRPLRHRVLRPHQTLAEMVYAGDDLPATIHLAAYLRDVDTSGSEPVGVVTLSLDPLPIDPQQGDYRLRGMALNAAYQNRGIGSVLVQAALDAARAAGGRRVWCNARVRAIPFYQRAGMQCVGERFEIDGIGPHERMVVKL